MKEKKSVLKKELNIVFVYATIFIVGLGIVFIMTNYINKQVENYDTESVAVDY